MLGCYIGYSAIIFLTYALCYKKINKFAGHIKMAKLLKAHYVVGTIAMILAIVHAFINMNEISVNFGIISLLFMICGFTTGILMKIFKGRKRNPVLYAHIASAIFALIAVAFHVIEYYILA